MSYLKCKIAIIQQPKQIFMSYLVERELLEKTKTKTKKQWFIKEPFCVLWGAPFASPTSKIFAPPLFDMKILGQPHRKSYKLNFPRKICGHFFKVPFEGSNV